ncbi:SE1561 family protein [Thalassobacillus sp. CUG 92003]|uniref:SE1561 family protein n=1 Tax=Thalassobacillus sp. CUG 92003 TaxID=2736641 RepID=UPI0015E6CB49|nr:SE1561 family protein [Thalassobacillus sp. CUG 92003]
MGKAAKEASEQFHYIQNRIDMLNQVVGSMDPSKVDQHDFQRVLEMIEHLQEKMKRFTQDWER